MRKGGNQDSGILANWLTDSRWSGGKERKGNTPRSGKQAYLGLFATISDCLEGWPYVRTYSWGPIIRNARARRGGKGGGWFSRDGCD